MIMSDLRNLMIIEEINSYSSIIDMKSEDLFNEGNKDIYFLDENTYVEVYRNGRVNTIIKKYI